MPEREQDTGPRGSAIPGFAIMGCMITGAYGIVHTAITGDSVGLVAAALAFGVVVHSMLR